MDSSHKQKGRNKGSGFTCQNAPLFTHVVHINPAGVEVAYRDGGAKGASAVRGHIASGRLMSRQKWLEAAGASRPASATR